MRSKGSIEKCGTLVFILVFEMILLVIWGCAGIEERSLKESGLIQGPNPPKVVATYAPLEVDPMSVLKIYLKASDPDGDIRYVYFWMDEPTGGTPVRLKVDQEQRRELSGYYFLDLWKLRWRASIGVLGFRIFIEDWSGRQSEWVDFSLRVRLGAPMGPPPEGVFMEKLLGMFSAPFGPSLLPGPGGGI